MKPAGITFRDLRMLVLAMQGHTARWIAMRMGISHGYVARIIQREAEKRGIVLGRKREAGRNLELARRRQDGVTWEQLAQDYGITRKSASAIYRQVLQDGLLERHETPKEGRPVYIGTVVGPREQTPFRPIERLPLALRINGARAAEVQKPMRSMATNPAPEWID